jgi:hypothetical protein
VPGRERVRRFLGREPSDEAFLERLGIGTRADVARDEEG